MTTCANFNAHPQTADGLRPDCKTCQAIENDIYYDRNRFAILDKRYEEYRTRISRRSAPTSHRKPATSGTPA